MPSCCSRRWQKTLVPPLTLFTNDWRNGGSMSACRRFSVDDGQL